jgi:hypothetical protein
MVSCGVLPTTCVSRYNFPGNGEAETNAGSHPTSLIKTLEHIGQLFRYGL